MAVLPDPLPRDTIRWLTDAVNDIAPATVIGVSQALDASRVAVSYACGFGMGSFTLANDALPEPLRPTGDDDRQLARDEMAVDSSHIIEWQLNLTGFRHLMSVPLAGITPAARVWAGLADAGSVGPEILQRRPHGALGLHSEMTQRGQTAARQFVQQKLRVPLRVLDNQDLRPVSHPPPVSRPAQTISSEPPGSR